MFYTPKVVNLAFDGETFNITAKDLQMTFKYKSVTSMYINNEQDQTAREMEVSLKKLKRTSKELADLLRFQITAHGISFSFTAKREQGEKVAVFVEDSFRQMLKSSEGIKPGSIADELRKELDADNPKDVYYPVYFHGCNPGFSRDEEEDENE